MKTIAIDTSQGTGSVAAVDGARLARRLLPTAVEHARLLAAAIVDVTAELGWTPAAADLVAVVTGPGSFTGLRVGVTTAKAIAWTTGARLLGVPAGAAIAATTAAALGPAAADGPIEVVFDAGRGDVFACPVEPAPLSAARWRVLPGGLVPAEHWLAGVAAGAVVAGPGLALLADARRRRPDLVTAPIADAALAPAVATLAGLRALAGEADDPAALVPEYIRPSYAEEPRPPRTPL